MAASHGKNAVFKIQDSGGTTRDISAYLTGANFDETSDVAEVSGLGATSKSYVAGLKDATLGMDGLIDPTTDGYLHGILGLSRTWEYHPQGTGTGTPKYSGSGFLTAYSPSTSLDDAGKFTATLQVTGDVTRALNP